MTAFAIVNLHDVTDASAYQEYAALAGPMLAEYGGKLTAVAKDIEAVEGSWTGNQIVILEFPNRAAFDKWYNSDDYAPLKKMRLDASVADFIVCDNDES